MQQKKRSDFRTCPIALRTPALYRQKKTETVLPIISITKIVLLHSTVVKCVLRAY